MTETPRDPASADFHRPPEPTPASTPSKRILVDICHPAHVHFFRHPIAELQQRGHEVIVTSRRKEMATDLLDELGIEHCPLCFEGGIGGLASELVRRDIALVRVVREMQPAAITGIGGIFAAHAGWFTQTPSVVFYDTENARLQNLLTYPLAHQVVAPRAYEAWLPSNAKRYPGYHELSYLHPDRFTASREAARANGLATDDDTFIVRIVAWKANHDVGERGWSPELLRSVVSNLATRGRVLISAEGELPPDLEHYRYQGTPGRIHDVLAFTRLFVGESATMASECAVLGVPAIYVAHTGRGYTNEQEQRYGLVRNIRHLDSETVIQAIEDCLAQPVNHWQDARQRLVDECVDVAHFVADTVEKSAGATMARR